MKLLFIGLLSLLGATSLALIVRQDPGYVLIDIGGWTIETAFSLFVVFVLALFVAAYFITRFLARLWAVPTRTRQWRDQRRLNHARRGLNTGLLELAEGNWAKAQKHLSKSARYSETPLLHYLGAARAAQQQTLEAPRDEFLKLAAQTVPAGNLAIGITQAELQLEQNQLELALATLKQLRDIAPNHPHVLQLLTQLQLRFEDWPAVQELLPLLRRHKVKTKQELDALERQILLKQLVEHQDSDAGELEQFWAATPKHFREDTDTLRHYLNLISSKTGANHDAAAKEIRLALHKQWDQTLITLYAQLHESDKNQQLINAEAWLQQHPTDPDLLLTLGILSQRNQLWGKSRSYLESSASLSANSVVLQALGDVLLELGDPEAAAQRYRQGLELATGKDANKTKFGFSDKALLRPKSLAAPDSDDHALAPESIPPLAVIRN